MNIHTAINITKPKNHYFCEVTMNAMKNNQTPNFKPPTFLTDYYPFGYPIAERSSNSADYRFGFNGQEKDDEIYGEGSAYDFGERIYDARLGKWFSIDPLQAKYPGISPYAFVANSPMRYIDIGGSDFGVKINHTEKTIIIVANIYTINDKTYRQATNAAKNWNAKKNTINGYSVSFQVNIVSPPSASDEEVVNSHGTVNFYKRNGELKTTLLNRYRETTVKLKAQALAQNDPIGNAYLGTSGNNSKVVSGDDFIAGQTTNSWYIDMNFHDIDGDMGEDEMFVGHELGHLFGLNDFGKLYYPGEGGILEYKTPMNNVGDNDVKMILKYVKDYINGEVSGEGKAKVTVIEEVGEKENSK